MTKQTRKAVRPNAVAIGRSGGIARREALAPATRSAIAKKAADERWATHKGIPKETHAGVLKLGPGIPCSVLDNGNRVFSVMGLLRAFGSQGKGRATLENGTPVPEFLSAMNLQDHISPDLRSKLQDTVEFRSSAGGRAFGYDADILALICDALLDARSAGVLRANQLKTAAAAEALVRAFSKVGVIALIDEATGYQADRASDELSRLVSYYVVEDMRPWVGLFPESFFRQVYRIHGWPYKPGNTQGPRYVGKFINRYVYDRLPKQVVDKLRELNPVIGKRRKHKHHQFLSEDIGEPTVDRHLASVTTLMSVAQDKTHFDLLFRTAFPKPGEQLEIGGVVNQPTLPASTEANETPPEVAADSTSTVVVGHSSVFGDVAIEIAPRISEKVLEFLRERPARFHELGIFTYGIDPRDRSKGRNTYNKLRRLLGRMREEGLVEPIGVDGWRLAA